MSSQKNQSLTDGITCLQALAMAKGPVGCRELARQLDMNVTRVNRLLMTLEDIGLAAKDDKRKYLPGPGIHVLANQMLHASPFYRIALDVVANSKPSFELALGLLWRDKVTYIYHGRGKGQPNYAGKLRSYHATESSIGLMLLAMKDAKEVKELYEGKNIPYFPEGLPDLQQYLEAVRHDEMVVMSPYAHVHHYNIAVPVGNPAMAALALTGIKDESDVTRALEEIQQIKEELERQLG